MTSNTLAIIAAIHLAQQQQFAGQPAIVQYTVELTMMTFPMLWNVLPVLINSCGILGSLLAIKAIQSKGRKELMLEGGIVIAVCLFIITIGFWSMDVQHVE